MTFHNIHLDMEAPRIGCGRRIVFLEKTGRKWATICCPYSLRRTRVPLRDWERIERAGTPARVKLKTIDATARAVPVPAKARRSVRATIKAMRHAARSLRIKA